MFQPPLLPSEAPTPEVTPQPSPWTQQRVCCLRCGWRGDWLMPNGLCSCCYSTNPAYDDQCEYIHDDGARCDNQRYVDGRGNPISAYCKSCTKRHGHKRLLSY